jgi:hypothetical protein
MRRPRRLLPWAKGPLIYGLVQRPDVGTCVANSRRLHARERDRPRWQVSSAHMRSRYRARSQQERRQIGSSRCVPLASHTIDTAGVVYLNEWKRTYKARDSDVEMSTSLAEAQRGHRQSRHSLDTAWCARDISRGSSEPCLEFVGKVIPAFAAGLPNPARRWSNWNLRVFQRGTKILVYFFEICIYRNGDTGSHGIYVRWVSSGPGGHSEIRRS